jgi:ABC-2 type transport system ATP-binding protein
MVQLDRISFGYSRQKPLFENLSLTLKPGHIYGLLGKNGAGKSSLLRNMAGLLFPTAGTIRVAGYEPCRRQPAFLQQLFFIPEEIDLPPVSIDQYISVWSPFYPHFNADQFRYYLSEFDIPLNNLLTGMSFGQKKKVLIGFGLATNTRVLIMDEPTNGLDIPSKSQFRKLVSAALEADRMILISTHQVRDLDNLIDSVIILEESQILLHQSLDLVEERLHFATMGDTEGDERILYAEPSLRGYTVVMENSDREESRVDLERLFHAVMNQPDRVRQIFERDR